MRTERHQIKVKKFTTKMQAKLLLVFCIVFLAMVGLIGRLVFLNHADGERYEKRVLSQQAYSSRILPYQRGDILDRKGTVLATSKKVYNLILDVKRLVSDKEYLTPTISALTTCYPDITNDMIMDYVQNKPDSQYIIVKKNVSYDDMMLFKDIEAENEDIQGVWFEDNYVRKYPYNTLASSVLGFTASGNVGTWGIEQYYNEQLNGTNGIEYGYIDSKLKLDRNIKPAINGNTIVSTIDANVQGIIQDHIKKFLAEHESENIGVVIMNPNNGEVLAMASNQEYDLNNPTDLSSFYTEEELAGMDEEAKLDALNAIWRNFAISDAYEPGSTFKPFTIAAGLEENVISPGDTFYCDGSETVTGVTIQCSNRAGHGEVTLTQALMVSCNDALMQIAAKEERSLFINYQKFFGFGTKTGIDLPGEAYGILKDGDKMIPVDLATNSFGQNFTNTMIQLASSFSSLVNGGYYYKPHMVKQIVNDKGAIVENIDKVLVKETVSAQTSEFLRNALYLTVEEGTAHNAQVPGYKIGGKTGTAEKQPRGAKKYLVSFIGMVPADNPEMVIYVVIDNPQNFTKKVTSAIATQLAGEILTEILPFLEIYPTQEDDVVKDPLTTNTPALPSTGEDYNLDVFPPEVEPEEETSNDPVSDPADPVNDPESDPSSDPANQE